MYKYKKIFIVCISLLYVFLTVIELIKYLRVDSNFYGVVYLLLSLIIIFFLVTIAYNYKKYYSSSRVSKLVIVIVLGLFTSFILNMFLINSMSYVDSSNTMIKSISFIKNILKPTIYFLVAVFTFLEINTIKLKK